MMLKKILRPTLAYAAACFVAAGGVDLSGVISGEYAGPPYPYERIFIEELAQFFIMVAYIFIFVALPSFLAIAIIRKNTSFMIRGIAETIAGGAIGLFMPSVISFLFFGGIVLFLDEFFIMHIRLIFAGGAAGFSYWIFVGMPEK